MAAECQDSQPSRKPTSPSQSRYPLAPAAQSQSPPHSIEASAPDAFVWLKVDNLSLLRAADVSLSIGSSMTLESLALGTPSAFYFASLQDRGEHKERFVRALPAPRLYTRGETDSFIRRALQDRNRSCLDGIAGCQGATARAWRAIRSLA